MGSMDEVPLDQGFDLSDRYDQVAIIYGIFICESCTDYYNGDPPEGKSLPYHVVGQGARESGWMVEPLGADWRVLCPTCREKI